MEESIMNMHLENELERYLSDNCPRFYDAILAQRQIVIYVSGTLASFDKAQIIADIKLSFPGVKEMNIEIIDDQDRLDNTDKQRRNLERRIQKEVADLVAKGELGANDIDKVWLRFKPFSRLLRYFYVDAKGVVMKVSLDPDTRKKNIALLKQVAERHGLDVDVIGTTLFRSARQEMELEKKADHI